MIVPAPVTDSSMTLYGLQVKNNPLEPGQTALVAQSPTNELPYPILKDCRSLYNQKAELDINYLYFLFH